MTKPDHTLSDEIVNLSSPGAWQEGLASRRQGDLESHNKAFEKALTRVQPEHERVVSERLRGHVGTTGVIK